MSAAAPGGGPGPSHAHGAPHLAAQQPIINFQHEEGDDDGDDDDDETGSKKPADKKSGRRKIKIEFINDKSRRHITFSKRKAGIMKKAYELSTLTGTQVLLLVVSETGLVYTFTTAKLQPLVTQPEGKNLIQACLNAPAGQIPTGAPIGQPGNSVHQANLHAHPHPHQQPPPAHSQHVPQAGGSGANTGVGVPHPASGVAQGLPPPTAMPPPPRNMPGGLSIGDKRGGGSGMGGDDDEMDDEEEEDENGNSASDDPISPLNTRGVGPPHMGHALQGAGQRSPPVPAGMQGRQGTRGGAAAAASHAARGAMHGVHPYQAGGAGQTRDGHRRRTSSSTNPAGVPGGAAGGGGKITSPRMGLQRQQSGMSDAGGGAMDTQSPTLAHYPGHDQGQGGGMYGYQQQAPGQGQPYGAQPPQGWGQPGVHPAHRR